MVNVMGFMQMWGLTIDLVTCIALQLALGLCVDYASHIGHTFLTIKEGTKSERSLKSITYIGSAVLSGGFSTLIGVCMLGFSDAYSFQTFFKVNRFINKIHNFFLCQRSVYVTDILLSGGIWFVSWSSTLASSFMLVRSKAL